MTKYTPQLKPGDIVMADRGYWQQNSRGQKNYHENRHLALITSI